MLKDKGGTEFILQDPGMKKMLPGRRWGVAKQQLKNTWYNHILMDLSAHLRWIAFCERTSDCLSNVTFGLAVFSLCCMQLQNIARSIGRCHLLWSSSRFCGTTCPRSFLGASRGNPDITLIFAGQKGWYTELLQHFPNIQAARRAPFQKPRFVPVITSDCKLEENYKFDPSLGPLKCPVLVFYGTKDGIWALWGGFAWLLEPNALGRDGKSWAPQILLEMTAEVWGYNCSCVAAVWMFISWDGFWSAYIIICMIRYVSIVILK